jgi:mono/diheme cytochrome c family protein
VRKALKWTGRILGGLLGIIIIAAGVLYAMGRSKLGKSYVVAQPLVTFPEAADAALVQRGQHVMRIHACQECHAENLGGKVFLDIPPAKVVASNLTTGRGGVGEKYNGEDWDRAVRYGVRPGGKAILPFMPYSLYHQIGDEDMAALAAYLEQLPPVDNELEKSQVKFPGYLMLGMPTFKVNEFGDADAPKRPTGPTPEYGQYVASSICVQCHGDELDGGAHPAPDAPPAPSLYGYARQPVEVFAKAVRNGEAAGGRKMTEWMPSRFFATMTDDEVRALYAYVVKLAAQPKPAE